MFILSHRAKKGFPVAPIEAMACGNLPVVAADVARHIRHPRQR